MAEVTSLQLPQQHKHYKRTGKKIPTKIQKLRVCSSCGSSKTQKYKGKYPEWRVSKITEELLCGKCARKEYRKLNPLKVAYYNLRNRKKIRSHHKRYYLSNKERIAKRNKEYRLANIEKFLTREKNYRDSHKKKRYERIIRDIIKKRTRLKTRLNKDKGRTRVRVRTIKAG
jgi:hypothetical protein